MAQQLVPATFTAEDRFLRRIRFADHMKHGVLHWRGFKEKDPTMSLTYQDASLREDSGLDAYRVYFSKAIGGDLPGIVWLSFEGLTSRMNPPLVPRYEPDIELDPVYGHLHCVVDSPQEKDRLQLLAKLVNDGDFGGILREFQKQDAA